MATSPNPDAPFGSKRRFDRLPVASGLPLETDIVKAGRHVPRGQWVTFEMKEATR